MNRPDLERLKKIVSTWIAVERQMNQQGITRKKLLEDEFSQWALTTPPV